MKNITRKSLEKDHHIIGKLVEKYANAIHEEQNDKKGHYDNQTKEVRIAMNHINFGLFNAFRALCFLNNSLEDIIEDEEE